MPAAAPLGADNLADLYPLRAKAFAEGARLRAALFTQVTLGRAIIELVVSWIADLARRRGMADQRNVAVSAQCNPRGGAVVGCIGRAACQHKCDEKRELDPMGHGGILVAMAATC